MTRRSPAEKPARRTITAAWMCKMLIRQAMNTGGIRCPLCDVTIVPNDETTTEHMHPLALGGADTVENTCLVHKQCARKKTIGTKATTAGSDIHAIAKGKRLRGETGQGKRKRPMPGSKGHWLKKPLHGNAAPRKGSDGNQP